MVGAHPDRSKGEKGQDRKSGHHVEKPSLHVAQESFPDWGRRLKAAPWLEPWILHAVAQGEKNLSETMPRTNGRSIYDFTQEEAWGGGRVVEGWPIAAAFCCWRLEVGRRAMEGEAGGLFGHRSNFKSINGGEVLSLFVSPSTQSQSRQDERHDHHKPKRDDDKPLSRSFANLKAQAMPLGGGIDREIEIAKWRRRYVLEIGGIW